MTEEEKKQRLYCMAVSGGVCEVCGRPLIDGQPQGAHRIGNTQLNRKLYGDIVIDSPLNMGYVCSLACNASLDISQNPHECLKLAKKIYESKLLTLVSTMKSTRKFYVGFNSLGTEYEFDYHWYVFAFDSKKKREEWLEKNDTKDDKEVARAITSKEMKKILPCGKHDTREFEFDPRTGLVIGIVYPW